MAVTALVTVLALCSYAAASCPADKDEQWSYDAQLKNGPEYWGETFPHCYGKRQSPINIQTSEVKVDGNLEKLQLTNYDKPLTHFELENNGHTVKITPLDEVTRTVLVSGVTYTLNQFHFHWGDKYNRGSEHTIDDKQFVMELHFVHIDKNGRIAVVGVFYQSSLLGRQGLSPITSSLRRIPYRGDKVEVKTKLNLDRLVNVGCSYYRYDGSLTTPGCDEGVTWSICKDPLPIGFLQISEFRKLYSTTKDKEKDPSGCKITNNFRPIQPLNDRTVTSSK